MGTLSYSYPSKHAEILVRYSMCVHKVSVKDYLIPDWKWMSTVIKGRWYAERGRDFMFENEQDAVMFALRWGS